MSFLTYEYFSKALLRGVKLSIFLPDDGTAADYEPPYKTLYFLPGYGGNNTQMFTYLAFRAQAELKGIAIVFPDGENSFYQDNEERNTRHSTFAGQEIVEVTRKLLPLSKRREDTFIGGISMGGYGAIYNGLRFRENFSKIIAFSPAVDPYDLIVKDPRPNFIPSQFRYWFGDEESYFQSERCLPYAFRHIAKSEQPELFLSSGTEDELVYDTVRSLHQVLLEEKVEHVYREEAGGHDFDFWERMMNPAFAFLAGIPETEKRSLVSRRD